MVITKKKKKKSLHRSYSNELLGRVRDSWEERLLSPQQEIQEWPCHS